MTSRACIFPPLIQARKPVHVKVDHRGGVEREHLADDEAADDGDAQGAAQLRSIALRDGNGDAAKHSGHGGHHDGPETQQAGLIDGLLGAIILVAFGLNGEIDHQDGVFLDDADQQDDADQGDHRQLGVHHHQRQQGADTRGGQRGENGDGVDVVLVENAEHDVDGDQRGQDQIRLRVQGGLKGLRGSLEARTNRGWQSEAALQLLDRGDTLSQRSIQRHIEGEGYGGEGTLMGNRKRRDGAVIVREGA